MIDFRLRNVGEIILVETELSLWEMEVQDKHGFVIVRSTDERVFGTKRAQYACAIRDKEERPLQIIKDWCFIVNFADCGFYSSPVTSACVQGKHWSYQVF